METIKYQGMSVEKFTDIYEFLDIVNSRPLNRSIALTCDYSNANETSSHSKDRAMVKKCGTFSWEEANDLFENGYEKGVQLILDADVDIKGVSGVQYKTDVVGCAPCIPNAIMGLPDSMIKVEKKEGKTTSLNIYYSNVAGWQTTQMELARAGRLLLDAIASLESKGIKIGLNLFSATSTSNHNLLGESYGAVIPLKKCDQPLNLKKITYPLVHPSFFRRHFFYWIETLPYKISRHFWRDYGSPSTSSRPIIEAARAAKIMQKNDLCICYYDLENMRGADEVLEFFERQNEELKNFIK